MASAVRRHYTLTAGASDITLRQHLSDSLATFGSDVLTAQEQRVVQLMLRGHSSKSCARELGISPTTERVHRRNIYAKLGISSQAAGHKTLAPKLVEALKEKGAGDMRSPQLRSSGTRMISVMIVPRKALLQSRMVTARESVTAAPSRGSHQGCRVISVSAAAAKLTAVANQKRL